MQLIHTVPVASFCYGRDIPRIDAWFAKRHYAIDSTRALLRSAALMRADFNEPSDSIEIDEDSIAARTKYKVSSKASNERRRGKIMTLRSWRKPAAICSNCRKLVARKLERRLPVKQIAAAPMGNCDMPVG